MKSHPSDPRWSPDDLSDAELRQFVVIPYGVDAASLPAPSYVEQGAPFWAPADLRAWLMGYMRGYAEQQRPPSLERMVKCETALFPAASEEECTVRAVARFAEVATASALTRGPFDPHK
jgi:hypothetical protein